MENSIADYTTVLEIDPNHINAAYARGACENKRGNFDKAIEDYHMALEKDKERPTSPKQRLGAQNRMTYQEANFNGIGMSSRDREQEFRTFDQNDNGPQMTPQYSESPMHVGRENQGYSNKNVLLSPGGQLNNIGTGLVRREDSLNSNIAPPLSKQGSEST